MTHGDLGMKRPELGGDRFGYRVTHKRYQRYIYGTIILSDGTCMVMSYQPTLPKITKTKKNTMIHLQMMP